MKLSVLDQAPVSEGATGAEALRHSVDLARRVDALGYHRMWVAEHHGTPMLACASPEALIATIGAVTSSMRLGSGGVMLPHYSPLKVAETFSVLAALHGDRIDLGLGRASGTDPTTAWALQRDRQQAAPDDFPQQLAELLGYLDNSLPARHPFARLSHLPGLPARPEPWLLGSSPQSGIWAAEAGLPYAFADFINREGADIAIRYRRDFEPSARWPKPYLIVAVTAICAATDAEAQRIASSARLVARRLRQGRHEPVPSIDTALRELGARPNTPATSSRRGIVGDPGQVRAGVEAVAAEYQADEVMLLTITHGHEDRCRSYELIRDAFRGEL